MTQLWQRSARELKEGYASKAFSVTEVAKSFIQRIQALNSRLKAYLYFEPDLVLTQAEKLDQSLDLLKTKPLFGIPVAVKDNISTRGVPTTAGSRILDGYLPLYDATIIDGLREAGALILGKTNLDEFAMGSSTENSAFGPTRNPWDLERVPGGSSGGSAAAVAARLAVIGIGSDTGGSIRQPASFTGTIGLKCTYGLVSRFGLIAFASSLDQIGPIGNRVEDIAWSLQAIARHDRNDSTSRADPDQTPYAEALQASPAGLRAGIPREYLGEGIHPRVRQTVLDAAKTLEKLGVKVEECSLPQVKYSLPAYYIIAPAEASSNLARFDGVRYGMREEGKDIQDMYSATRGAGFGAEVQRRILLGTYVLSSGYYDAYYLKAMKVRKLITNEFLDAFKKYDILVTPTSPTPAFKIGEKVNNPLEMYLADVCTIAVNLAGIPAISVPGGLVDGMPVGVQFMAAPFAERTLLTASQHYLEETRHHLQVPALAKENG